MKTGLTKKQRPCRDYDSFCRGVRGSYAPCGMHVADCVITKHLNAASHD